MHPLRPFGHPPVYGEGDYAQHGRGRSGVRRLRPDGDGNAVAVLEGPIGKGNGFTTRMTLGYEKHCAGVEEVVLLHSGREP